MPLARGEAAPYDCVAVPPSSYREFHKCCDGRDVLEQKLAEPVKKCPECDDTFAWGAGGMVVGSLLTIVITALIAR